MPPPPPPPLPSLDFPQRSESNLQMAMAPELVAVKSDPSGSKTSRLSGLQKIGIFSHSLEDDNIFELFLVDADFGKICGRSSSSSSSSDYIEIFPKIRFKCTQLWGACVLDSTFYLFEGNSFYFNNEIHRHELSELRKSVKKLVLSPEILDDSTTILGLEQLEELAPMNFPKRDPIAVPTPDGKKILVFAATIGNFYPHPCSAFELYDPLLDTWEELEPPRFGKVRYINVYSYTFVKQSLLLLETDQGVFFLDIELKPRICCPAGAARWKDWKMGDYCHLVTIDERIILSPWAVFELESGAEHKLTLSDLPNPGPISRLSYYHEPRPTITFLDYEDEEKACYSLVTQSQMCAPKDRRLFICLDVCRTCLNKLDTTSIGNLKYTINSRDHIFFVKTFVI